MSKRKIKGQLVLKFLVALVLGLIIYGTTAYVIAEFFRLSDASTESFGRFTVQINQMKDKTKGEVEAVSLYMDEGTLIAIFNKGVDPLIATNVEIYFPFDLIRTASPLGTLLPEIPSTLTSRIFIERPSSCSQDNTCICLIRSFTTALTEPITDVIIEYNSALCSTTKIDLLYTNKGKSTPLLFRSKLLQGPKATPRERAIFLERGGGNFIGICTTSPCLTATTGDVRADLQGLSPDAFMKELLDKSYSLESITRDNNRIVARVAACSNPKTNPLQILFTDNNDGAIDFIWDAKEEKVYARDKGKDKLLDLNEVLTLRRSGSKEIFTEIAADWEYEKAIIPILESGTFGIFISRIADRINWDDPCIGDCLFMVDGDENLDTTSALFVQTKITKNRPEYLMGWIDPGTCAQSTAGYICNYFQQSGKCDLQENGNVCVEGKEQKCGETCFCPEDYKDGDIFRMAVGDQEWEFTITESTIRKECIYNCPQ